MKVRRVVSGGQTGADRAALDAALALGVPYGGWCPRGGWAEDLPEPPGLLERYPRLMQTPSDDPAVRTAWNVRDSDATLVLVWGSGRSVGTEMTVRLAQEAGRPLLVTGADSPGTVADWLDTLPERLVLDVAGPRESEAPGVHHQALRTLLEMLGRGR